MLHLKTKLVAIGLLTVVSLTTGCSDVTDPPPHITVVMQTSTVEAGSPVWLTATNAGRRAVTYSTCQFYLEERIGDDLWRDVASFQVTRVCALILQRLEPGDTATLDYFIPIGISPGVYRIVNPRPRFRSPEFYVVAAPDGD